MNETIRNIMQRRSTRKFLPDAITEEQIRVLEDAALAAPTGMNRRELRFTFIRDKEKIEEINRTCYETMMTRESDKAKIERLKERRATSVFYGAPLVILISGKKTGWEKVDAGIAVQNLTLAAESLGLGSCIVGMIRNVFDEENPLNLNKEYSFVDGEEFYLSVAIGHKGMDKEAHEFDRGHIRHLN